MGLLFPLVVTLLAALRVVVFFSASIQDVLGAFDDDAYYYFGVARTISEGGGSSFNGVDLTNGYHPLWLLVLVPIFFIFRNESAQLSAVLLVEVFLFFVTAYFIEKIRRKVGAPAVSLVPIGLVGLTGPSYFFNGMETGLLLFFIFLFVLVVVSGATPFSVTTPRAFALGCILGGVVLSRLDAAILILAFIVVFVPVRTVRNVGRLRMVSLDTSGRPTPLVRLLLLLGPAAFLIASYAIINKHIFGTYTPVSGQAKALGTLGANLVPLQQWVTWPLVLGLPTFMGPLSVMAVVVGFTVRDRLSIQHNMLWRTSAACAIAAFAGSLYYALFTTWPLWPWYFYASPLSLMLALMSWLPVLGRHRLISHSVGGDFRKRSISLLLVAGSAIIIIGLVALSVRSCFQIKERDPYISQSFRAAAVLSSEYPGSGFLMGDRAGSFGFHLTNGAYLLHTEGLVESKQYLDELAAGTPEHFFRARNPQIYVSSTMRGELPDNGCSSILEPSQGRGPKMLVDVCRANLLLDIPLKDGTHLRAWRVNGDALG